jgi:hypothetical protein
MVAESAYYHGGVLRLLLALLVSAPLFGADWYLFTSFRRNGETGVFFALSQDGRKWAPLNNNQPWLKPGEAGMLMRDPWLGRGPDGTWHMLWTRGWTRAETGGQLKIGYARSKDLVHWSAQRAIPATANEPTARNAWAPEAVWDAQRKEWIVFWSSTIPGRFPETDASGDNGYNHRVYAVTTRDFETFTPAKLWFDPGFNSIDATLAQVGKRWIMVFKDERKTPLVKRLRTAISDSPRGPWREVGEPFTGDWVEGPSVTRIGREWWIYFDHYSRPQHYGGVRTTDWKTFEDVTPLVSFPEDHRHGTVVAIPEELARRLQGQPGAQ